MSKHRVAKAKKRVCAPTVMVGAAAGLSAALVMGSGPANAAETLTVIGVGGASNPNGDRIPPKLQYGVGVAENDLSNYIPVNYPASVPIDDSVAVGTPILVQYLTTGPNDTPIIGQIRVVGYSEGSVVAERAKRELDARNTPPRTDDIEFWFIASPSVPDGGIYSRFPGLPIPGFENLGAAQPSAYDQTFVTAEYDGIADFPAYANPLSIANAIAGIAYRHGDATPDATNLNGPGVITKTFTNDQGTPDDPTDDSTETYYLILADHLPILQPIRDIAAATQTTQLTEPVLGAIEPTLRLAVDMGYTDRDLSNANKPTPFSLLSPRERIIETATTVPAAVQEGTGNATGSTPSNLNPNLAAKAVAPQTESESAKTETPEVTKPRTNAPKLPPLLSSDGNKATPNTTFGGSSAKNDPLKNAVNKLKGALDGKKDTSPAASESKPDAA